MQKGGQDLAVGNGYEYTAHLVERQDLYALEHKAMKLGDKRPSDLTRELHRTNDAYWLDRVVETGVAGVLTSFLAPVVTGARPTSLREIFALDVEPMVDPCFLGGILMRSPVHVGYGVAMMMGQLLYNDISQRAYQPQAHFFHSHERTARDLEVAISHRIKSGGTIEELHGELKLESAQDSSIQVQKELSIVRRALALNGVQK